jgi:tetratricopeptide (TPR) repeat protein
MNNPWLLGIFVVGIFFFGVPMLRVLPVLMRLIAALASGAVRWPGPIIHDPDPKVNSGKQRLGWRSEHLFSTLIQYTLGLVAAFFFLASMVLINGTSLLAGYIQMQWTWQLPILILVVYIGGTISSKRVIYHMKQVNRLLSDLASGVEPRQIDGSSAEAEYAIEHPLIERQGADSDHARALKIFSEATRYFQVGDQRTALALYQEAINIDPALHERAREALSNKAQSCSPKDAGSIYYWLGLHAEYLMDWKQAQAGYEEAINAFNRIGYQKRESRAHCNLGNVKMRMRDESAMDEFEKAIALNPRNGSAYLNIGRIYYGLSEPGDYRFEQALEAFADAIVADPLIYGPMVIASLRQIGYTWKKDLEDITQRVERKRH